MRSAENQEQALDLKHAFQNALGQSARNNSNKKKSSSVITFRITDAEHQELKQLSQGASVSAYIRECVFKEGTSKRKRQLRTPIKDQTALAKALGLLGQSRIPNNLNQLAYQANTGSLPMSEDTLDQVKEAYDHVRFIRRELIKALGLIEKI